MKPAAARRPRHGVWINQIQTWACEPYTYKPHAFDSADEAKAWLEASGFVNTTDTTVHMSAYVADLASGVG